jgi:Uri superfamily endonuclease
VRRRAAACGTILPPVCAVRLAATPEGVCSGAYVLRIAVGRDLGLVFGRFAGGAAVPVPVGEYAYVGSAMARAGWPLAARVLRHATRTRDRPPHAIRDALGDHFAAAEAEAVVRRWSVVGRKRRHWHIDYLLDELAVDLIQVILIPSPARTEGRIARFLVGDPHTCFVRAGLGAADVPGGTHLVRVDATEAWWQGLPCRLRLALQDTVGYGQPHL